ncbi:MAG: seg [Parcubacteria group bacterium]|nr:seg [Parcubacteria group bacterium]
MEYQVPQFIEVEDKIIGPLTFKQFIYVAGGAGLCVIAFVYLNIFVALLLTLLVAGFTAALAFYRVNGKPFIEMLEAGFNYYTGAKLFLWKQREDKPQNAAAVAAARAAEAAAKTPHPVTKLTRGKLSQLAWSLDTPPDPDALHS